MSVEKIRKYLSLGAVSIASLVSLSAVAGGPDVLASPDYSGIYVEGGLGYELSDWESFHGGVFNPNGNVFGPGSINKDQGTGGFTFGGDLGYQFNQYFSAEVGAYDLDEVKGTFRSSVGSHEEKPYSLGSDDIKNIQQSVGIEVNSWLLYAAGKIAVPVYHNLDAFGKAGIAWRFLDYSRPAKNVINSNTGRPVSADFYNSHYTTYVLGCGLQYWFTQNWSMSFQYLHVPSESGSANINQQAPNVDLFLVMGGYKFST